MEDAESVEAAEVVIKNINGKTCLYVIKAKDNEGDRGINIFQNADQINVESRGQSYPIQSSKENGLNEVREHIKHPQKETVHLSDRSAQALVTSKHIYSDLSDFLEDDFLSLKKTKGNKRQSKSFSESNQLVLTGFEEIPLGELTDDENDSIQMTESMTDLKLPGTLPPPSNVSQSLFCLKDNIETEVESSSLSTYLNTGYPRSSISSFSDITSTVSSGSVNNTEKNVNESCEAIPCTTNSFALINGTVIVQRSSSSTALNLLKEEKLITDGQSLNTVQGTKLNQSSGHKKEENEVSDVSPLTVQNDKDFQKEDNFLPESQSAQDTVRVNVKKRCISAEETMEVSDDLTIPVRKKMRKNKEDDIVTISEPKSANTIQKENETLEKFSEFKEMEVSDDWPSLAIKNVCIKEKLDSITDSVNTTQCNRSQSSEDVLPEEREPEVQNESNEPVLRKMDINKKENICTDSRSLQFTGLVNGNKEVLYKKKTKGSNDSPKPDLNNTWTSVIGFCMADKVKESDSLFELVLDDLALTENEDFVTQYERPRTIAKALQDYSSIQEEKEIKVPSGSPEPFLAESDETSSIDLNFCLPQRAFYEKAFIKSRSYRKRKNEFSFTASKRKNKSPSNCTKKLPYPKTAVRAADFRSQENSSEEICYLRIDEISKMVISFLFFLRTGRQPSITALKTESRWLKSKMELFEKKLCRCKSCIGKKCESFQRKPLKTVNGKFQGKLRKHARVADCSKESGVHKINLQAQKNAECKGRRTFPPPLIYGKTKKKGIKQTRQQNTVTTSMFERESLKKTVLPTADNVRDTPYSCSLGTKSLDKKVKTELDSNIVQTSNPNDSGIGRSLECEESFKKELNNFFQSKKELSFLPQIVTLKDLQNACSEILSKGRIKSRKYDEETFVRIDSEETFVKSISRTLYSFFRPEEIALGLQSYFNELNAGNILSREAELHFEWLRFATFGNYEGNGNAMALARNGFYYDNDLGPSGTRCVFCKVCYSDWHLCEDVEQRHRELSPHCPVHGSNWEGSRRNIAIADDDGPRRQRPLPLRLPDTPRTEAVTTAQTTESVGFTASVSTETSSSTASSPSATAARAPPGSAPIASNLFVRGSLPGSQQTSVSSPLPSQKSHLQVSYVSLIF